MDFDKWERRFGLGGAVLIGLAAVFAVIYFLVPIIIDFMVVKPDEGTSAANAIGDLKSTATLIMGTLIILTTIFSSMLFLIFFIITLAEVASTPYLEGRTKILWFIGILIFGVFGSIVYYFLGRKNIKKKKVIQQ